MQTTVGRLSPGDLFQIDIGPWNVPMPYRQIKEYRLIYATAGRAYVEPLRKQKTDVLDEEEKKSGRTNIALETVCTTTITKDPLDDDDDPVFNDALDQSCVCRFNTGYARAVCPIHGKPQTKDPLEDEETIIMDALDNDGPVDALDGSPVTTNKRQKRQRNSDGSRNKEPGTQTRAIKDGTIRAKLFAAMKTTKSVEKLMVKTGMKRTLLLSHINDIWRHHGFGYTLSGDKVELIPPKKVAIKK